MPDDGMRRGAHSLVVAPVVALVTTLAGGGLLFGGCAHAESFDGEVLHKADLTVKVGPISPAWRRIQVEGADLAFRDDAREGSALFDVRCGRRDDDAPLSALTDHLLMGTTMREIDRQETIPFDGREAMRTLARAKLDGVPMQYEIYVMKKDGCVYDIVYVAPPARFADGAQDFERFTRGVHALSSPRTLGNEATSRSGRPSNEPTDP
jgi:hypothetical protein